jgi:two-component system chemotaxis response regulator CheB
VIRVLIVDDSAVVRAVLTRELAKAPDIKVVGAAPDPYVAREMIASQRPDVLTLDMEMPRMDGLSFLRQLMRHYPLPAVVVSSITPKGSALALDALGAGAFDVLAKPDGTAHAVGDMVAQLVDRVRAAALVDPRKLVARAAAQAAAAPLAAGPAPRARLGAATHHVVAIGASTGGTVAVESVLRALPADAPGTVVTLHMPPGFTKSYAERLSASCRISVREARDGEAVVPGVALIAPGNRHLKLVASGASVAVALGDEPPVNRHRPSVDVLFQSAAQQLGAKVLGVILTGMGADGAAGLLELRRVGGATIAQDEASCVVFGMPRAAIELGAAEEVASLDQIPTRILARIHERTQAAFTPQVAPVAARPSWAAR